MSDAAKRSEASQPASNEIGPVVFVVGTRPEAIKVSPVVLRFRENGVDTVVVSSGQHRDLCAQALSTFGLTADHDLEVMTARQSPNQVVARTMVSLDSLLTKIDPSWLFVQGDTASALAAAMTGSLCGISVAHIEAGLRSHDRSQPFPEEINRSVITSTSSMHFAPTVGARSNLLSEGVAEDAIMVTGNTTIDAQRWALRRLPTHPASRSLRELDTDKPVIYVTLHRRENLGLGVQGVLTAVDELCRRQPSLQVFFALHPNPAVRDHVRDHAAKARRSTIILGEPLTFLDSVWLLRRSAFVLTDSGGLQEEAPSLGVRTVVTRETTERQEAVAAGIAVLAGTNPDRIVHAAIEALAGPPLKPVDLFGDGRAADRIVAWTKGQPIDEFLAP